MAYCPCVRVRYYHTSSRPRICICNKSSSSSSQKLQNYEILIKRVQGHTQVKKINFDCAQKRNKIQMTSNMVTDS